MQIQGDERIDWFRVIVVDLCNAHGYKHSTIAAAIGTARSTVRGWIMGSEPRFDDGERLLTLWADVTKKRRETAPTISRYSCRA